MLIYRFIEKVTPSYSQGGSAEVSCSFVAKVNSKVLRWTPGCRAGLQRTGNESVRQDSGVGDPGYI